MIPLFLNNMGMSHSTKRICQKSYEGKDVFVGKSYLGRVSPGYKLIIYESHGAKAYTGWADIKSIGKQKKRYSKKIRRQVNCNRGGVQGVCQRP